MISAKAKLSLKLLLAVLLIWSPFPLERDTIHPRKLPSLKVGTASYYGKHQQGQLMANGRRFNRWLLTAASRTLPLGSLARVTYLKTRKSVVVRITDRGPFIAGRIIDLSEAAAKRIDLMDDGIGTVIVEALPKKKHNKG